MPDHEIGRRSGWRAVVALSSFAMTASFASVSAHAQQLTQRFVNPSFGGNPFNSEHLLAIANAGRPKEPQAPPLTDDELLISQIRARLASQLSSDVLMRIQNARPGDTGEFTVGDQVIRFVRTATETRVTFTNTRTGAVSETILPVRQASSSTSGQGLSAEAALGMSTGSRIELGAGELTAGSLELSLGLPRL